MEAKEVGITAPWLDREWLPLKATLGPWVEGYAVE